MPIWETVAPLLPMSSLPNREHRVGPHVWLRATPDWLKREREFLSRDTGFYRSYDADACLTTVVEAEGLGAPDDRLGTKKPNDLVSCELLRIANLSLWLARPSPLHIAFAVTAEPNPAPSGSVIRTRSIERIYPHPEYETAKLSSHSLGTADAFASSICRLHRPSSVWQAIRFVWLALTQELWEARYINLWIAIESLFGPKDGRDVSKRLSKRVACFFNSDHLEAVRAYNAVLRSYALRCTVAHGDWDPQLDMAAASSSMLRLEGIALTALRKILGNPTLIETFSGPDRNRYLDSLAHDFRPSSEIRTPGPSELSSASKAEGLAGGTRISNSVRWTHGGSSSTG